ncbi:uncharacterized protein AMSG_10637 [Thecamonas trahens ATCC 50062]|uniref:Uncharacterized protein n=1 Tax=Thecamonas trahens ATCC 50062 TaxID=461836 RepID=A0A0L0DSN6_THETB|nr:hypothetical protein AMSG_10637 [Thecamonas trahens ATCC 50062]KNC55041.1 hypothetical protein AMSG_10637 [Thecamonas trahens ATCC 50062]|eukprot:XP_013753347.1 hypothetical protein AMSG_10637 [Thecamonas trahens ATCC 50062]
MSSPLFTSLPSPLVCELKSNTWSLLVPPRGSYIPTPRHGHAGVLSADGTRVYIIGGITSSAPLGSPDGYAAPPWIEVFEVGTGTWQLLEAMDGEAPVPRLLHGAAMAAECLVIAGGLVWHDDALCLTTSISVFDLTTHTWHRHVAELPEAVMAPSLVCVGDSRVAVVGGNVAVNHAYTTFGWLELTRSVSGDISVTWHAAACSLSDDGARTNRCLSISATPLEARGGGGMLVVARFATEMVCYVLDAELTQLRRVGPAFRLGLSQDMTLSVLAGVVSEDGRRVVLVPWIDLSVHDPSLKLPRMATAKKLLRTFVLDDAPIKGPCSLVALGRTAVVKDALDTVMTSPSVPPAMVAELVAEARLRNSLQPIHVGLFRTLSVARISWVDVVDDDWLKSLVHACPHLVELDISGSKGVTSDGLVVLGALPCLERLGVAHMEATQHENTIDDLLLNLPQIRQLNASHLHATYGVHQSRDAHREWQEVVRRLDQFVLDGRVLTVPMAIELAELNARAVSVAGCGLLFLPNLYNEIRLGFGTSFTDLHSYYGAMEREHGMVLDNDLRELWTHRLSSFCIAADQPALMSEIELLRRGLSVPDIDMLYWLDSDEDDDW